MQDTRDPGQRVILVQPSRNVWHGNKSVKVIREIKYEKIPTGFMLN